MIKSHFDGCIVVGSGISAIMTALTLTEAGISVLLISKNSDPRLPSTQSTQNGSTWGGECTRCITPFESHSFLAPTPLHPSVNSAFRLPIEENGWLLQDITSYSQEEQIWLNTRYNHTDNEDSNNKAITYHQQANANGIALWNTWRKNYPELFYDCQVCDQIVDIYETKEQYLYAQSLHERNNTLLEYIDTNQLKERLPFLIESMQDSCIYSALLIKGFSLDIQQFIKNSLYFLERNNCDISFNHTVTSIEQDKNKHVTSICTTSEKGVDTLSARFYSLHVGAYDSENILTNTVAHNKIHGVAGRWLRIPITDEDSIEHSMKFHITAPDHANHINLALWKDLSGQAWLLCGAGHAYVGKNLQYFSDTHRSLMDLRNHNAVKRILPSIYYKAQKANTIIHSDRECVRSWSANDIPIFDVMKTQQGGKLIITGGSGTGTTSIAPAEAQEIRRACK